MTTIADLQPDPRNANKGTARGRHLLEKSLSSYGAGRSILLDKHGKIIAGNKTAEVAAAIGLEDVVIVESDGTKLVAVQRTDIDLDTEAGRMMAYADNRVGQVDLDFDIEEIIADVNAGLPLDDFWFESEIDQMIAEMVGYEPPSPGDAEPQTNRAEELRQQWQTETGQLWRMASRDGKGEHRLIVGDCTDRKVVERVMGGERADILFTDPPYGINLIDGDTGKVGGGTKKYPTKAFSTIQNDDKPFDPTHLLDLSEQVILWGGNYFADKLQSVRCWFVWDKKHPVERTFAGCELAWTNLNRHAKVYQSAWDGWTKEGENGSKVHPTQKPVKLCTDILLDIGGVVVLDAYAGSGTTLIACENLNRQCRAVEISPAYCAVILQRYQDAFGITPELIA